MRPVSLTAVLSLSASASSALTTQTNRIKDNPVRVLLSGGLLMVGCALGTMGITNQAHADNELIGYDNEHNTSANPKHALSATSQKIADQLIAQANAQNLATNPSWLRMHYYEVDGKQRLGVDEKDERLAYSSKIDNPDFFLSEQGKDDPKQELETFIKAMVYINQINKNLANSNNTPTISPKQNPLCRFPARAYWLKDQLNLPNNQFTSACPEFNAWFDELDPQRLSVFLAEEYPDRMVSAFGHMLMLIDSSASLADPSAIDEIYVLNDDVAGDPDDSAAVFAIKASTGGYPNDITIDPYPEKLADYVQKDNRDVWTYALDLTTAEVEQIIRHVWETKDLQLPYYFTLDNCASEVLRYIDIVRPQGNLLDQFKVAIVPGEVVRLLHEEGLLINQEFLPSDNTLAQAQINNPNNKAIPDSIISVDLTKSSAVNENDDLSKNNLIGENARLITTDIVPNNNNPIDRHALQRVMTGVGIEGDTPYIDVALRFGFHDLLDNDAGYPQNFDMQAGSAGIRIYSDKDTEDDEQTPNSNYVELDHVTILQGRSFNPLNTVKNGEGILSSWGVRAGAQQVKDGSQINSTNHFVADAMYEKGVSYAFGTPAPGSGQLPPHLCYALGSGGAQVGKGLSHGYRVGVGATLGCQYQLGSADSVQSRARLIGEITIPYWYHGDVDNDNIKNSYWQPVLSLGAQYDIDRVQAIRLQGTYELQDRVNNQENIQLAYVRYF